jgi:hypothetical protein
MNEEWSSKDLIAIVPIVSGGFAFSYVVGYFLAFDISWFPFFSLSEHMVFAIRALPIAIGASVALLIALRFPHFQSTWHSWVFVAWIGALAAAAAILLLGSHFALSGSLLLVAAGAIAHRRSPAPQMSFINILYWTITLMVLCLLAGYMTGNSWQLAWRLDRAVHDRVFPFTPSTVVILKDKKPALADQQKSDAEDDQYCATGQVIFVGSAGVLFYEYKTRTTYLFKQDDIKNIQQPAKTPGAKTEKPQQTASSSNLCTAR